MVEPPEIRLANFPVSLKCPHCKAFMSTVLKPKVGLVTFLFSGAICLVGGVLGCCLIPFFVDCTRNVGHYCSHCKKYIGKWDKIKGPELFNPNPPH